MIIPAIPGIPNATNVKIRSILIVVVIVLCLLLAMIVVFIAVFFTIGNSIYKRRQVSNKLHRIELFFNVIHNPETSEAFAAEHTTVLSEEGSVNSEPAEVEQKKECKDIVPGSSEEEIFSSVVHTSYEESVQANTE